MSSSAPNNDAFEKFTQNLKKPIIRRLLIATRGLPAIQAILAIRHWLAENFGSGSFVKVLCISTTDDKERHHLKLTDEILEAPAGDSATIFENADAIVAMAVKAKADAVFVGWGDAAGNADLPKQLSRVGITFIGPDSSALFAASDRVLATVVAQSVGVPTCNWNGIKERVGELEYLTQLKKKVDLRSIEEGLVAVNKRKIKLPFVIKTTEGKSGRGYRKCDAIGDFLKMFEEVQQEVPDSPYYIMEHSENVHILKIALLVDDSGDVLPVASSISSNTSDTEQIIEVPATFMVPMRTMNKILKQSAKFLNRINYRSAATIEFLFEAGSNRYHFHKCSPFLDVESPSYDGHSQCNLHAIQYQIALGIRLNEIAEVVELRERRDKGEDRRRHFACAKFTIQDTMHRLELTSESGGMLQLGSDRGIFSYFSISKTVKPSIRDQIAHVFAVGNERREAIANLIHALKRVRAAAPLSIGRMLEMVDEKNTEEEEDDLVEELEHLEITRDGPTKLAEANAKKLKTKEAKLKQAERLKQMKLKLRMDRSPSPDPTTK